jgi:hypothetical protein
MTLTIGDLILEAHDTLERFWFVRDINIIEQTQATVTVHLMIDADLFVQAFLSESSQRLSFALVGQSGRLYGRDREHGRWHRHPFGQPEQHEPTSEGMSVLPLTQFMAEVEKILVEQHLL